MKKQLFASLLAVIFLGIPGVVKAEKTTKDTVKNWRNKSAKRSGGAASVIWTKYSKEREELHKLRKDDPEAFKLKSNAFYEKLRKKIKAERGKFKKLVMEYRKTQDPKTREAINKYVSAAYERRLNATAKRLAAQTKRLKKAEKKLADDKAKKEERINKRLKRILKDPKLSW